MAIRKILLPLTGTAAGEAALSTALMAAGIWNAHVTALHVRVDSRDVAPLAGEGLSGAKELTWEQANQAYKDLTNTYGLATPLAAAGRSYLKKVVPGLRSGDVGAGRT